MMKPTLRILALTMCMLAVPLAGQAAPSPMPIPTPNLPNKPLHSIIVVQVNKKGQVVHVTGGRLSHNEIFDTMSIGNALQMWIRRPDGSATVGTFRVNYDYDPRTHNIQRRIALISTGGKWANQPGAATRMIQTAQQETRAAYERMQAQDKRRRQESAKHLPDINAAVKRALATPSPHP